MIANGISIYLENQGIATGGTDLFVDQFPDTPDDAISVNNEAGTVLVENRDRDSDVFGVQILIRGSYSFCNTAIRAIHRNVPMLKGEYDSIRIIDTWIATEPTRIEIDEKGRNLYSVSYECYCNLGNSVNRTSNYSP